MALPSKTTVCGRSLSGVRVRIPPEKWMSVFCECRVLSGRGLCDEPIPCPKKSYRLWCATVYDLETPRMWRSCPSLGCCTRGEKKEGVIWVQEAVLTRSRHWHATGDTLIQYHVVFNLAYVLIFSSGNAKLSQDVSQ